MSSSAERAGERRAPRAAADVPRRRARLTVVPRPARRSPRVPFVLLVVISLGLGVVGLLLVNTSLQQGAFETATLSTRATALLNQVQSLQLRVDALRSPQRVADAAHKLGMVPDPNPAFLRLPDGRVLGVPRPGVAGTGSPWVPPQPHGASR
jgi:cell division protein FtsL